MKNISNIAKVTATAFAVAFIVYSCKGKLDVAEKLDLKETPVQTVDNMFVVNTENGVLQMRMEAYRMERYDNDSLSYELFPDGFAVYAYTADGLLETQIVSDQARHLNYKETKKEVWEAFGNVKVQNVIKKEVMETDTLYWDRKNEKIYTHCYVKLYSPDGFMQGYGMESDERARHSVIKKPFDNYVYLIQDSTKVFVDSVNFIGPLLKK